MEKWSSTLSFYCSARDPMLFSPYLTNCISPAELKSKLNIFQLSHNMNADRRRVLGPEMAVTPIQQATLDPIQLGSEDGSHIKFFLKSGLLKNASGLAYLEIDDTIIEISVYGPRPIKGLYIERATLSVECHFLPYITQPNELLFNGGTNRGIGRTGLTSIEQRISSFIETAFLCAIPLEKYPKSTVDVFINVLSFNSITRSLLNLAAWTATCTSLAMVDAGIEMRDLVTGGHVQIKDGSALLDPTISDDEKSVECVACFTVMHNNDVVALWMDGDELGLATLTAQLEGCKKMSELVRSNVNGYLLDVAGSSTRCAEEVNTNAT